MKRTDLEIIQNMPMDNFEIPYDLFQSKNQTAGRGLAVMAVYNLGKLHGIRQERAKKCKK
ncbi:TPA: hypothetical protein ACGO0F_001982 [Streptococcus suis]